MLEHEPSDSSDGESIDSDKDQTKRNEGNHFSKSVRKLQLKQEERECFEPERNKVTIIRKESLLLKENKV